MRDDEIRPGWDWDQISLWCDLRVYGRLPANGLLVLLGIERQPDAVQHWHGMTDRRSVELTPREKLVTQLLAHGLSRQEIAEQLHVGLQTVQSQLTSARQRLGAKSVAQLTYRALKEHQID